MGQLLLPLFPFNTQMLTPTLGVIEKDGCVYYLHSGVPIYSHLKDDLMKFRYYTSHLLVHGLCRNQDIVNTFHVSVDSVRRWKKTLSEEGESAFFKPDNRHGHSYKLTPTVLSRIQSKLDLGQSNNSIAKAEDISEGSIRYYLSTGKLKKKIF